MNAWKASIVVLFGLLLGACAGAPPAAPPAALFDDALFTPPSQRIDVRDVFAMNDDMKRYAAQRIVGSARYRGTHRALVEALYTKSQLKLDYDSQMTRTAAEAFEARAGNCLSLVIMTAAFAKDLGLKVQYQSVSLSEAWSRSGDLLVGSGHVNLSLSKRADDVRAAFDADETVTIDFLPPEQLRSQRMRVIDEPTVIAMYLNNKATEALAQGRVDDAYWWVREAVTQAPGYTNALNTLGVVYLWRQALPQAERTLDQVLQREPDNTQALGNLASVLKRQGRTAEAEQRLAQLARIEPYPPFHFFNLGQAALQRGDDRAARDLFAREVNRAGDYHEFHFWLAVAHARLGEWQQAQRELTLAMQTSNSRGERDLYAAKLARLHASRLQ